MSEYFLNGKKKDGSWWLLCGGMARTLEENKEVARKRIESGEFVKVQICEWAHRVVEEVD